MLKHLIIPSIFFLIACGDNIVPDRDRDPEVDPDRDWEVDPGDDDGQCTGSCTDAGLPEPEPDAGTSEPDAGTSEPDAGTPDAQCPDEELPPETKASCCHSLLGGSKPDQVCGYPPGLCKNGKKDVFCSLPDGTDARFTLCNP